MILLDVDTDDKFTRYLDPTVFAETLIKNGLSKTVHTVIFLASDLNSERSLRTFSRELITKLQEEFKHEVTAYVPTDLNYIATLLVPPKKSSHDWQIFGLPSTPAESSLTLWKIIQDKTLLWEGADLLGWLMTQRQRAIHPLPDDIDKITFAL